MPRTYYYVYEKHGSRHDGSLALDILTSQVYWLEL